MKKLILEIEYDDTDGYKGHGEDTDELIINSIYTAIEIDLVHDNVIKEYFKIKKIK
ncbi:MAG: hypothetical protein ACOC2W_04535 [bacterium]